MRHLVTLAAVTALSTAAHADEIWDTSWGRMHWETDLGGRIAVLTVPGDGAVGALRMFVEGLAEDVAGGRDTYIGVWAWDRRDGGCAIAVADPVGGKTTRYWGTFRITFVEDGFPSAWAGVWGECADAPTNAISGQPNTGN
jgi:hypothetical protein